MTKSELILRIGELNPHLYHRDVERIVTTIFEEITEALAASTWSGHFMPYGPTKFDNGQNTGARPINTQVLDKDIKVILPAEFANAKAVFPAPARG